MTDWGGLSGVFWFTAALAFVGLVILFTAIPQPNGQVKQVSSEIGLIKTILTDKELLRLDWGILVLHMVLMANFVVIPGMLETTAGIDRANHWWVYLPMLLTAFVMMLPLMLIGERKGKLKPVFLGAIAALLLVETSLALLGTAISGWALLMCLLVFFVAFNLLEATLPSQVSKMAPNNGRGSASGVYSSSQFLGAFLGGTVGGGALLLGGTTAVFVFNALALATWLIVALPMVVSPADQGQPRKTGSYQTQSSRDNKAGNMRNDVELESI